MVKAILGVLITAIILVSSGCNHGDTQSSSPLVVDLLAVSRALGRDEVMTQKLQQASQQLNDQLVQISATLEQQLKDKKSELDKDGKKKKEESRKELEQFTLKANLQLKKTRQLANQKAILYRDQLVDEFRQEVMAVAEKIAQQRQAVTIFTASSDLLWYSSSIDITDEIIGEMRAQANDATEQSASSNEGIDADVESPTAAE